MGVSTAVLCHPRTIYMTTAVRTVDGRTYGTERGGLAVGLAGCTGNSGGSDSDDGNTDGSDDENGDSGSETEDVRWRAGTPGEGSSTFAIANGLSRILDEQESSIDLEVASYSGSNEAIRLVGRGEDEMAGSALPLAAAANRDEEPVPDGPADFTGDNALEYKPVQALNFLDFRMYWITLEGNDIETVDDFEGKDIECSNAVRRSTTSLSCR